MIEFLKNWETLIGSIVGGLITLTGIIIAWYAVTKQIKSQERIASSNADDAFKAVQIANNNLYGMLNLIWRLVDVYSGTNDQSKKENAFSFLATFRTTMPTFESIKSTEEIGPQLKAVKRKYFLLFNSMIRSFYEQYDSALKREPQLGETQDEFLKRRNQSILAMRIFLTHCYTYLLKFDPENAAQFADRKKSNVDHREMYEHLSSIVDEVEGDA